MKKHIISTGIAISALSFAFAQGASATAPVPLGAALPPMITTGDTVTDAQVKALYKEMEAKIKALRDEYQAKVKTIVGDKKPVIIRPDGSTTTPKEVKKEMKEERKDMRQEMREDRKETREAAMGTTTGSTTPEKKPGFFNWFRR